MRATRHVSARTVATGKRLAGSYRFSARPEDACRMAYVRMRGRAPMALARTETGAGTMLGAPLAGAGTQVSGEGCLSKILRRVAGIVNRSTRLPLRRAKGGPCVSLPAGLNIAIRKRSIRLSSLPIRRMASVSPPSRPSNRPTSVSDSFVALSIEGVLAPALPIDKGQGKRCCCRFHTC